MLRRDYACVGENVLHRRQCKNISVLELYMSSCYATFYDRIPFFCFISLSVILTGNSSFFSPPSRVPTIRLRSLILFFIWFSVSLCYYGVTYYIPNLYGDKYLNFILSGGIELAAYLLAFVVLGRVGNKKPTQKNPKKPT
jgi:hypothetical protein